MRRVTRSKWSACGWETKQTNNYYCEYKLVCKQVDSTVKRSILAPLLAKNNSFYRGFGHGWAWDEANLTLNSEKNIPKFGKTDVVELQTEKRRTGEMMSKWSMSTPSFAACYPLLCGITLRQYFTSMSINGGGYFPRPWNIPHYPPLQRWIIILITVQWR